MEQQETYFYLVTPMETSHSRGNTKPDAIQRMGMIEWSLEPDPIAIVSCPDLYASWVTSYLCSATDLDAANRKQDAAPRKF